jgi:hypothetical protein
VRLTLALVVLLIAAPAAAQAPARGYAPPPARTAAAPTAAPKPAAPVPAAVVIGSGLGNGLTSPLRPLGSNGSGLSGLAAVGDPAPQCRSRCAAARYVCDGDADNCAQRWNQCVTGCTP